MKYIKTKNAPEAIGPYSQAVEKNNTLFISGQIPFIPKTMKLISQDVVLQTKQCLKNIDGILQEAKYSKKEVVKVGIFLTNMNDFDVVNKEYEKYFDKAKPARFAVEVTRLPKDCKIEIDAIAMKE